MLVRKTRRFKEPKPDRKPQSFHMDREQKPRAIEAVRYLNEIRDKKVKYISLIDFINIAIKEKCDAMNIPKVIDEKEMMG